MSHQLDFMQNLLQKKNTKLREVIVPETGEDKEAREQAINLLDEYVHRCKKAADETKDEAAALELENVTFLFNLDTRSDDQLLQSVQTYIENAELTTVSEIVNGAETTAETLGKAHLLLIKYLNACKEPKEWQNARELLQLGEAKDLVNMDVELKCLNYISKLDFQTVIKIVETGEKATEKATEIARHRHAAEIVGHAATERDDAHTRQEAQKLAKQLEGTGRFSSCYQFAKALNAASNNKSYRMRQNPKLRKAAIQYINSQPYRYSGKSKKIDGYKRRLQALKLFPHAADIDREKRILFQIDELKMKETSTKRPTNTIEALPSGKGRKELRASPQTINHTEQYNTSR